MVPLTGLAILNIYNRSIGRYIIAISALLNGIRPMRNVTPESLLTCLVGDDDRAQDHISTLLKSEKWLALDNLDDHDPLSSPIMATMTYSCAQVLITDTFSLSWLVLAILLIGTVFFNLLPIHILSTVAFICVARAIFTLQTCYGKIKEVSGRSLIFIDENVNTTIL